jgi:tetratricopeptide (TPR) repeat protein
VAKEFGIDFRIERPMTGINRVLIIICFVVLLSFAVGIGIIYVNNSRLSDVLPRFENALESQNYDQALKIYRDIHARVVSESPDMKNSVSKEKEILFSMENVVDERVTSIEYMIRYERYTPSADDRAFLEQMKELTGASLSIWLDQLSKEFLLGTIEKPTLQFIFDQIGDYSNVVASSVPLKKEIDNIEIARGEVQEAEQLFRDKAYIEAAAKYESVLEGSQGFVYQYAQTRLSELKIEMYDPIMEQCDHMLDTFKYYSAEEVLSNMARIFPDDLKIQSKLLEATSNTMLVEEYTGSIEVICVKPIIADTDLAFSADALSTIDSYYLTKNEFRKILESLYEKDYVLVDALSIVDVSNSTFLLGKTLLVPQGKKPLIIVLEDFNYSAYRKGNGLCSKIVFNDQGYVCGEYINAAGQTVVSRTAEAIGILDAFVEENPDFSFNGAKGVISLTGYETIFGYITNADQIDDRNEALSAVGLPAVNPTAEEISTNIDSVSAIISVLKDTGWIFGSSTYGYINANDSDMETIQNDTQKWLDQVLPLTGQVHVLVYPNGNFIKGSDDRAVYLKNQGFRVFFGVGPSPYYTFGDNYLYYDRAVINGDTLRNLDYSRLFQASVVYDSTRIKGLND